jgi:UDP-N-acetylglucosamine transferase subunit ALG13
MIFATVGTHEQPFDRLVQAIDELKGRRIISHEVFIQSGYSKYQPQFCDYAPFIGFNEMIERIKAAEIVITHGGTGSIMLVLYNGKIPVVMPRQKKFNEHIDDHQVRFCETMESKGKILAIYEVETLSDTIANYVSLVEKILKAQGNEIRTDLKEQTGAFAEKLESLCLRLLERH